jgi:hypothetical protein
VIPSFLLTVWTHLGTNALWFLPLQILSAVGLIFVADWVRTVRDAGKDASVRELEALFALEDSRDGLNRRSVRQK